MLAQKSERNSLLAQLHIAIKQKKIADEAYRDWLDRHFSVRSSKDLDDNQLICVVKLLRSHGLVDGLGRGATEGNGDRPTDKQWACLAGLSRGMGWGGLESKGLQTFVRKIAKVESPRFLDRQQIGKVIYGLKRWKSRIDQKSETTGSSDKRDS